MRQFPENSIRVRGVIISMSQYQEKLHSEEVDNDSVNQFTIYATGQNSVIGVLQDLDSMTINKTFTIEIQKNGEYQNLTKDEVNTLKQKISSAPDLKTLRASDNPHLPKYRVDLQQVNSNGFISEVLKQYFNTKDNKTSSV